MVYLLSWLLVAGIVAGAIFVARTHEMASLARATLTFAILGGPIVTDPELRLHEPVHPLAAPLRVYASPGHGGVHR